MVFFIILNLSIFFILIINGHFSSHSILKKAIRDSNPYQITFFTSDFVLKNFKRQIRISEEYPVLTLRWIDLQGAEVNFLLNSTVLTRTLHASIIVIHTDNVTFARRVIDLLSRMVPYYERPKCLCMLLNKSESFDSLIIKNTLRYAWEKKFLDFTIIKSNESDNTYSSFYYFDPFHYSFQNQKLIDDSNIFPNKLRNINNYPIKVGRGGVNLTGHNYQDQEAEWARQKVMVNFVLRNMGFDLEIINYLDDLVMYDWHYNSLWFTKANTNVIGGLVIAREFKNQVAVVFSELECRSVLAVVPIIFVPKVIIPVKILFYIFVVPGIVLLFICLINFFKPSHIFEIFDAVKIFLGQPVSFVPRRFIQKVIHINIVLLFVLITNDLYSGIVEINFDKEEVSFNSLEDLDKSGMAIYTRDMYEGLNRFDLDDPLRKSLDSKIQLHPNCMKYMVETRNHICVDWEYDIKAFIEKNRNSDGSAIMKIAKSKYHCDPMFVQFEPGSPYMKRFTEVNRRIRESGMLIMEYISTGFVRKIENVELNKEKDERNLSEQQLLFVLGIGYSIATAIFVIECLMKIFKKVKIHLRYF